MLLRILLFFFTKILRNVLYIVGVIFHYLYYLFTILGIIIIFYKFKRIARNLLNLTNFITIETTIFSTNLTILFFMFIKFITIINIWFIIFVITDYHKLIYHLNFLFDFAYTFLKLGAINRINYFIKINSRICATHLYL